MRTIQTAIAIAATAVLLSACGKNDDNMTAGQKLDSAVATAEQKTDAAKAEVKQEMAEAKVDAKEAAATVGTKVDDAMITAGINAELAKDPSLSALKINVDTSNGAVTLHGSAPSSVAKERATTLAATVKGVTSVNNQLVVNG